MAPSGAKLTTVSTGMPLALIEAEAVRQQLMTWSCKRISTGTGLWSGARPISCFMRLILKRMFAMRSRSEEHTSELQSLMRISYAVFCLKKKKIKAQNNRVTHKEKHNI